MSALMGRRQWMLAFACLMVVVGARGAAAAATIDGGDAQWIWTPEQNPQNAPPGVCYFRKTFRLGEAENGRVEIACDNRYELFVNGRSAGGGDNWKKLDQYDIRPLLINGLNVIAVRAENDNGPAGLVARVTVKQKGNTDVSYSTDNTWLTSTQEHANWQVNRLREEGWKPALAIGEYGEAAPWKGQIAAAEKAPAAGRFMVAPQFRVERVGTPDVTGSLVAMAFNERGDIIASRERGPLVKIRDTNADGVPDTVSVFCDKVTNCQGILPLNGDVFAVGDGPDKTAFYRISDQDGDGVGETVKTLLKFKGGMQEHGPHAALLGPDGLIYVMIGNHATVELPFEPSSPHGHYYEGDLVQPRYEDAGGHAVGIKAPGGIVVRTNLEGNFVELYAGGFRNAYDFAFNKQGDLFTFDSDMEWDEGLPWYRPTRVNHIIPGGEYGWRSGWANWPEYFVDSLPATINIGRGSPTGLECYNHHMYPVRYHNSLFIADWSLGRIIVIRMEPAGGTYQARSEVFLQGKPLNVTDLAVGPDGWMYFTTGGRDTEGGIYRVVWTGKAPPRPKEAGIIEAIRQPQLFSAWGRNKVANVKRELGDAWAPQLLSLVKDDRYSADDRCRALDLMQLVGPSPQTSLLLELSTDAEAVVRAKAIDLMGIHVHESTNNRLLELLRDPDPTCRRKACESLVRADAKIPPEKLYALLAEPSRYVSWAAVRGLQRAPRESWQDQVLAGENPRLFLMGSVALLGLPLDRAAYDQILTRGRERLKDFLNDEDFVGLLRVMQVTLAQGKIPPGDAAGLAAELAEEYPALDARMNRELARLLVYLQEPTVVPRIFEELERADNPIEEKLHLAMYSRFLKNGCTLENKLDLMRFYEYARTLPGGHSFRGYLDNASRDLVKELPEDERWLVVKEGASIPNAGLTALAMLPEHLTADQVDALVGLDQRLLSVDGDAARRLGVGIIAVLGRSKASEAMAYLRNVFEQQPERRQDAAMGLAQNPNGENWELLIRALPVCEGPAAQEVLMHLGEVNRVPDKPEPLRQTILAGLRLGESGSKYATSLLEKWTGQKPAQANDSWDVALASWQSWFAQSYPDQPPPQLPQDQEGTKWTMQQLHDYLATDAGEAGSPERGAAIFDKAQCVKCHKYGNRGEGVGPDLSGVSRRFQRKEILESVLYPSHVISDQYASKTVVTSDGLAYTGIVGASGEDAVVVTLSTGEKQIVKKSDIEEIAPSSKSAMPEGLFNNLTLEEIADLMAYLSRAPQGN